MVGDWISGEFPFRAQRPRRSFGAVSVHFQCISGVFSVHFSSSSSSSSRAGAHTRGRARAGATRTTCTVRDSAAAARRARTAREVFFFKAAFSQSSIDSVTLPHSSLGRFFLPGKMWTMKRRGKKKGSWKKPPSRIERSLLTRPRNPRASQSPPALEIRVNF